MGSLSIYNNMHQYALSLMQILPFEMRSHLCFRLACRYGKSELIERILKEHPKAITSQNHYGLRVAARFGHKEAMRVLLSSSQCDPNANYGHALRLSVRHGYPEIFEQLLSHPKTAILPYALALVDEAYRHHRMWLVKRINSLLNTDFSPKHFTKPQEPLYKRVPLGQLPWERTPKEVDDFFRTMALALDEHEIEDWRSITEDELAFQHFGLALWIRNTYFFTDDPEKKSLFATVDKLLYRLYMDCVMNHWLTTPHFSMDEDGASNMMVYMFVQWLRATPIQGNPPLYNALLIESNGKDAASLIGTRWYISHNTHVGWIAKRGRKYLFLGSDIKHFHRYEDQWVAVAPNLGRYEFCVLENMAFEKEGETNVCVI